MDRATSPSPAEAAGMLASVRQIKWGVRTHYMRALFGGVWFISLLLALATFGSLAMTTVFGTRTTDGGQAAFGTYWAAAGLVVLLAVWRRSRREPVSGRAVVHLLATCAVFALGFATVFFSPLAHNHIYLSPALFTSAFLLVAGMHGRVWIAAVGLVLGAGLGLGSLSTVLADGRGWPAAIYGSAFLVAAALFWLVERRAR